MAKKEREDLYKLALESVSSNKQDALSSVTRGGTQSDSYQRSFSDPEAYVRSAVDKITGRGVKRNKQNGILANRLLNDLAKNTATKRNAGADFYNQQAEIKRKTGGDGAAADYLLRMYQDEGNAENRAAMRGILQNNAESGSKAKSDVNKLRSAVNGLITTRRGVVSQADLQSLAAQNADGVKALKDVYGIDFDATDAKSAVELLNRIGNDVGNVNSASEAALLQMQQYDDLNRVYNDYQSKYSGNADFTANAVSKGFSAPSTEDFVNFVQRNDGSTFRRDDYGLLRNQMGEVVTDGFGYTNRGGKLVANYPTNDVLGLYKAWQNGEMPGAYAPQNGQSVDPYQTTINAMTSASLDALDESEERMYYYLLNTQGTDAALEYLNGIAMRTNKRKREQEAARIGEMSGLELALANAASVVAKPIGDLVGLGEVIDQSKPFNPYSDRFALSNAVDTVRGETANRIDEATNNFNLLGISLGDVYQAGMSSADSLFGVATMGNGFTAFMGASAALSEARKLKQQGASDERIFWGSTLAGVAEAFFEDFSIEHLINMRDANTVRQAVKNMLVQGGIEASEEMATEIANIITNGIVMGSQSDMEQAVQQLMAQGASRASAEAQYVVGSVFEAGVGGLLSGGFSGAPSIGSVLTQNRQNTRYEGALINNTEGGLEALRRLAEATANGNSRAQKRVASANKKVGENASDRNVGKLSQRVDAVRRSENVADIASKLETEAKMGKFESRRAANVIADVIDGVADTITQNRYNKLIKNDAVRNVVNSAFGIASDVQSRNRLHGTSRAGADPTEIMKLNDGLRDTLESKNAFETVQSEFGESSTEENLTSDGEVISSMKALKSVDGKLLLEASTESGTKEVEADSVAYADENLRLIYGFGEEMGASADTINEMVQNFADSGQSIEEFLLDAEEAYTYGKYGIEHENRSDSMQAMYGRGRIDAQINADRQQAALDALPKQAKANDGGVIYEGNPSDYAASKGIRAVSIEALDKLGKETGIRFHIFKSYVKDGKRVYMVDGNEVDAPNGYYKRGTRDIYIDFNAGDNGQGVILTTAAHELTHFVRSKSPKQFKALADFLVEQYNKSGVSVRDLAIRQQIKAKADGRSISFDEAMEEVVADSMERMLVDDNAAEKMAALKAKDGGLWQTIKEWFEAFFQKIQTLYKDFAPESAEGQYVQNMEQAVREKLQELFFEGVVDASEAEKNTDNVLGENAIGYSPTVADEVNFSTRKNGTYMKAAERVNKKYGFVDSETMNEAKRIRELVAKRLEELSKDDSLLIPEDVEGNTFITDSSYGGTEENTTVCPRSLAAEAFVDEVAKMLGRPLTVAEQLVISQDLQNRTASPECLYCYVATDRKAYREFLGEYLKQRDRILSEYRNGNTDTERYSKEYLDWLGEREPTDDNAKAFKKEKKRSPNGSLYDSFLNGEKDKNGKKKERKDTKNMWARFQMWIGNEKNGSETIEPIDLASIDDLMKRASSKKDPMYEQLTDAMNYAQSASWAKKRLGYVAYNGHILKWKEDRIKKLNNMYGLRMYSFSDFSPAFILENMQMITDASVRGLKALAYTKELDFVKIFAPSGININISVFGFEDGNGGCAPNEIIGANWEQAKALRDKYPNVGCTFVATSESLVNWALDQDWIDVVIPYHLVRTGEEVRKALKYTNFTSQSSDKKIEGLFNKDVDEAHISAAMHNNDQAEYERLLKENHLEARFKKWQKHPKYMKLVNETRQSVTESAPVQPVFDYDAAQWSLAGLAANGYTTPIGGNLDTMRELAAGMADRLYQGDGVAKSARNKEQLDKDYMAAVERGDDFIAQQILDFAAKNAMPNTKVVDEEGNPLPVYHGTSNGGFTVFDQNKQKFGLFGMGFYFTESPFIAEEYQEKGRGNKKQTYQCYLNITNPIDMDKTANGGKWREAFSAFGFDRAYLTNFKTNEDAFRCLKEAIEDEGMTRIEGSETVQDVLRYMGYDGITHVGGGRVVKNGVRHRVWIAFDSEQIKSANIATFDDDGNFIPLSERFDLDNADIRYSARNKSQTTKDFLQSLDTEKINNDLERKRMGEYQTAANNYDEQQRIIGELTDDLREARKIKGAKGNVRSLQDAIRAAENRSNIYAGQMARFEKDFIVRRFLDRFANDLETKHKKAIADQKAADRKARDEKIAELKKHNKEVKERAKARKANTEIRNKIRRLVDKLNDRLNNPHEGFYVPTELTRMTVDILDAINMDTGRSERISEKIALLKAKYDSLKNDPKYSVAYDDVFSDFLQQLTLTIGDTPVSKMSSAQLTLVYQVLKALHETIVNANKVTIRNEEVDAYKISKQMTAETNAAAKADSLFSKWLFASLRPETAFERLGGFAKDSAWRKMATLLNDGQLKATRISMEAQMMFESLAQNKQAKSLSAHGDGDLVDIGLKDADGNKIGITRGMMLSIYMHLQNEQNRNHIAFGGMTVPDMRKYYNGKMGEAFGTGRVRAVGVNNELSELYEQLDNTEDDAERFEIMDEIEALERSMTTAAEDYVESLREAIENKLTEYEREWVLVASRFFDDYSKRILNAATMEMYHFEKANVDKYYPIHTDANYRTATFESIARDASLENAGFMKDRQTGAKNPILLEDITDVINSQIRKISSYAGLAPAIRSFQKIYGKTQIGYKDSIQNALASKFGTQGKKYIENVLADLTQSRQSESTIFDALRGNMAAATLTLNPRVALAQTASFPTAAAEIGWKPLLKALAKVEKQGGDSFAFARAESELIAKYSPLLWHRMQGYRDTEMGDIKSSQQFISKTSKKLRWAMGWIQAMDGATVGRLWYAAQYYVDEQFPSLKSQGDDAYYGKVAEVFNRIVERTQPNYTVMQRPDILRNPNALMKQLTMFMTQRLQNFNIVYESAARWRKYSKDYKMGANSVTHGDLVEARKGFAWGVSSQLAAAVTIAVFKFTADALMHSVNGYRDDDGEIDAESIGVGLINTFADSVVSSALWGSEAEGIAKAIYKSIESGSATFDGISVAGIENFNDSVTDFLKLIGTSSNLFDSEKRDVEGFFKSLEKVVFSGGQVAGVPLRNLKKLATGVRYHVEDATKGNALSFESGFERNNSQLKDLVYDALANGDNAKYSKYAAMFEDDKKLHNAIRNALKEREPKIEEAARMRMAKNMDGYLKIVRDLKTKFSQDDVVAAINSMQSNLEKGDAGSETKPVNVAKTSDYIDAIDVGQTTAANELYKYLFDSAVSGGKTKDEAKKQIESNVRSEIKKRFESGIYSDAKAIKMLDGYGGMDKESAEIRVAHWKFTSMYNYDWSEANLNLYNREIKKTGISVKQFDDYLNRRMEISGEGRKQRMIEMIDSLPLSREQKNALYLLDYKESGLSKTPWY